MWNRQLQLRWTTVALALVALIAPAAPAESADRTAKPFPSMYAVRAKRIYTMAQGDAWFIDDGVMLVRDGKVAAVGADIELPPFIRLIEMPDAVIAPGFVLANSSIVEPHAAPDSVGPQFRAADSFNAFANYRQVTAGGVTTVYLNPGAHRLIAGQGFAGTFQGHQIAAFGIIEQLREIALGLGVVAPGVCGLGGFQQGRRAEVGMLGGAHEQLFGLGPVTFAQTQFGLREGVPGATLVPAGQPAQRRAQQPQQQPQAGQQQQQCPESDDGGGLQHVAAQADLHEAGVGGQPLPTQRAQDQHGQDQRNAQEPFHGHGACSSGSSTLDSASGAGAGVSGMPGRSGRSSRARSVARSGCAACQSMASRRSSRASKGALASPPQQVCTEARTERKASGSAV